MIARRQTLNNAKENKRKYMIVFHNGIPTAIVSQTNYLRKVKENSRELKILLKTLCLRTSSDSDKKPQMTYWLQDK